MQVLVLGRRVHRYIDRAQFSRCCSTFSYPRYLVDEKAGKVDRSILDIHYVNVYFTSTPSSTRVLDTGSVAKY